MKIRREYLLKVFLNNHYIFLVLPETLKGLTSEYEELKKDSLQENALQLLSETQNKNEKTMKRLMKFFNSDNNENEYENNTFEESANPLEDSEIINNTYDENNTEYFEPPKRRKGRPRKLKAITESEETVPSGKILS